MIPLDVQVLNFGSIIFLFFELFVKTIVQILKLNNLGDVMRTISRSLFGVICSILFSMLFITSTFANDVVGQNDESANVTKYYQGQTLYYQNGDERAVISADNASPASFPDTYAVSYNRYNDDRDNYQQVSRSSERGYSDDDMRVIRDNVQLTSSNTFVFDPRRLSWAAYDPDGNLLRYGKASGGRGYCPDIGRGCRTPTGSFRVHAKQGANCISSKYPVGKGGAKMPYCMFFKGGFAVHGSYDVPRYNASHGCIRVPAQDAKWLNYNFMAIGTRVIVKPY